MGFWIFMMLMDLLIPATMIGFGCWFRRQAPAKINPVFGYRTRRSMQNRDTWAFAHRTCGAFWFRWGWVLLPVSVVPMLLVLGRPVEDVSWMGGLVCLVQLVPMMAAVPVTERRLKQNFDEVGRRR